MFDIIGFLNCLAEKNVERKEKRKKEKSVERGSREILIAFLLAFLPMR